MILSSFCALFEHRVNASSGTLLIRAPNYDLDFMESYKIPILPQILGTSAP